MTPGVLQAIDGIERAFPGATVSVTADGSGGAYLVIENVHLGDAFRPATTWIGGHLPPQLPYADVYPLFIDAAVVRSSGVPFSAPITAGHAFGGRPALQVSRRTNRLDPQLQTAAAKFQKVLHWLQQQS